MMAIKKNERTIFHRLQWSVVLAVVLNIQGTEAILCNRCQYSVGPLRDCVNPTNVSLPTVNCSAACLTSVRTIVATGDLYYIERGCDLSGTNGCDGLPVIEQCDYKCSDRDLCNDKNYEPAPKTTPEPWTGSTTIITETPGTRDCYSCVYSYHPDAITTCLDDPSAVPYGKVRCSPDRVCTIFRQWIKGENVVRSFSRSCLPPPNPTVNSCVEDTNFITYNTYCSPELCNSGDGMLPCPPPGGGGDGGGGDPGKAATIFSSSTGLIWIATSAAVVVLSNYHSI